MMLQPPPLEEVLNQVNDNYYGLHRRKFSVPADALKLPAVRSFMAARDRRKGCEAWAPQAQRRAMVESGEKPLKPSLSLLVQLRRLLPSGAPPLRAERRPLQARRKSRLKRS